MVYSECYVGMLFIGWPKTLFEWYGHELDMYGKEPVWSILDQEFYDIPCDKYHNLQFNKHIIHQLIVLHWHLVATHKQYKMANHDFIVLNLSK